MAGEQEARKCYKEGLHVCIVQKCSFTTDAAAHVYDPKGGGRTFGIFWQRTSATSKAIRLSWTEHNACGQLHSLARCSKQHLNDDTPLAGVAFGKAISFLPLNLCSSWSLAAYAVYIAVNTTGTRLGYFHMPYSRGV